MRYEPGDRTRQFILRVIHSDKKNEQLSLMIVHVNIKSYQYASVVLYCRLLLKYDF
jgi:hypothetical protein